MGACILLAVLLGAIGALAGSDDEDAADQLVSAESTTTEATTTSTTEAATTTAAPPTTTAPPTTQPSLMPDVVCMNLQDAQDTIQRAGVFFSRSEDATGQDRFQVIDSNWIVVAQTPSPGSPIGELEAVLSVVKLDEPHAC